MATFLPWRYYGFMKFNFLNNLLKRFQKASPTEKASTEKSSAFLGEQPPSKRPEGFSMPKWTQKDFFAKKEMGTMVPPEELVGEASLRRPGEWLKKKILGADKDRDFEKFTKTPVKAPRKVGLSDGELDDFLGDFLKEGQEGKENKTPRKKGKGP